MAASISACFEIVSLPTYRCLRHFTYHVPKISLHVPLRMSRRSSDGKNSNSETHAWRVRGRTVLRRMGEIFWIVVIYIASELLIWCLSLALRLAGLQFLSSILGMLLVFASMVSISQLRPGSDGFYRRNIKSKVDFINSNLGVGFPVPIIIITKEQILAGKGIGRVIGNFFFTNVIFWVLGCFISWGILAGILGPPPLSHCRFTNSELEQAWQPEAAAASQPRAEAPLQTISRRASDTTTLNGTVVTGYHTDKEAGLGPESRTVSAYFTDSDCPTTIQPPNAAGELSSRSSFSVPRRPDDSRSEHNRLSSWAKECYPMALALFFLFVVGIPVSSATRSDWAMEGCMIWFTWVSSTRLQRGFSRSHLFADSPGFKTTAVTLLNPVLLTTLTMVAYTRAKAAADNLPIELKLILFSSGNSLSDLMTAAVDDQTLREGGRIWFGAGDMALSILECGIVVWGFKLFECRRQIWSRAGAAVVLISVGMAALNVFLSVIIAIKTGLGGGESLSFAARSTTLALARPAMAALHGNRSVNAALVVSNGILGQLMYPYVLPRLGIEGRDEEQQDEGDKSARDDALTIAVGAAIGINGAAMGVSYLYERENRAAPYAALSMTVFGVMTVVFTAVEPFTTVLLTITSEQW
ncbi:hypothetical protein CH063_07692 [Colletotrichum higginsianum]|uniref:LrgB-like family protein n=2 Tax=Colletotrichum higginsianum TaxID=80884 RepID=H1V737_COLHI|nr:hypothetical protein CH63R_03492 [Colletotrichum higginsianum IMI 349063]OBR14766.1 hypothetical protein CH63R_03492 [Colletotrichum higginsianum IMI 349063]CCF36039.1 hypothetical protein CH063_07692 [Colletotrichum higginsianum]